MLTAKLLGKKTRIVQDASRFRPYDVERLVCNNKKAQRMLGWKATVSLEEGLKKTINLVMKNAL